MMLLHSPSVPRGHRAALHITGRFDRQLPYLHLPSVVKPLIVALKWQKFGKTEISRLSLNGAPTDTYCQEPTRARCWMLS